MLRTCIVLTLTLLMATPSFAQTVVDPNTVATDEQGIEEDLEETAFQPRSQISTIVYMGLGGAILGLSTLSFYGRPQDRLSNIAIGFGVGVIIGAIWVTWKAARKPTELYEYDTDVEFEYEDARNTSTDYLFLPENYQQPLTIQYGWTF